MDACEIRIQIGMIHVVTGSTSRVFLTRSWKHRNIPSGPLFIWLVVGPPLWKIWKSIGMIIPNIWENKKWQPNHQPVIVGWILRQFWICLGYLTGEHGAGTEHFSCRWWKVGSFFVDVAQILKCSSIKLMNIIEYNCLSHVVITLFDRFKWSSTVWIPNGGLTSKSYIKFLQLPNGGHQVSSTTIFSWDCQWNKPSRSWCSHMTMETTRRERAVQVGRLALGLGGWRNERTDYMLLFDIIMYIYICMNIYIYM